MPSSPRKVALVTGSGRRRIGRAVAQALAAQNAQARAVADQAAADRAQGAVAQATAAVAKWQAAARLVRKDDK